MPSAAAERAEGPGAFCDIRALEPLSRRYVGRTSMAHWVGGQQQYGSPAG